MSTEIKVTKIEGKKVTIEINIDDSSEELSRSGKNVSLGYMREEIIPGFTLQINAYKKQGAKIPTNLKAVGSK